MKVVICLLLALCASVATAASFPGIAKPIPLRDVVVPATIEGRITNGQAAKEDQFPYQVGLSLQNGFGSSSWCGGSLIGNQWVLTAAHCTNGAARVTVYLGSTVRTSPKVSYIVDRNAIMQHSGYVASTLSNDISLIKIPAVAFSSSIQAIRLPGIGSSYATYAGNYAVASGWGRTSDTSSVAANLNYARLQVISNTQCSSVYGTSIVTANTICVSTPAGTSTCQGDSGGPLVLESNGVLVGVTSFVASAGCAAGYPSGFVRVTEYLQWIKLNTGISY